MFQIHIPHFKMRAFLFELLANHECSSKFATCWCRLHLDRLKSPKTKLWDRTRNLAKLCLKCVSYGNLGFLGLIHTEDLSFHFISCATLKISFLFIYLNKSTGSVIKFIYDADFKDLNVAIKLLYLKSRFIKSFTQLELRPLREPILCEQTKHRALAIWYKINHARPHF